MCTSILDRMLCLATCGVLQCVAVCCSVLQCVTMCCSMLQSVAICRNVSQCVATPSTTKQKNRERRGWAGGVRFRCPREICFWEKDVPGRAGAPTDSIKRKKKNKREHARERERLGWACRLLVLYLLGKTAATHCNVLQHNCNKRDTLYCISWGSACGYLL